MLIRYLVMSSFENWKLGHPKSRHNEQLQLSCGFELKCAFLGCSPTCVARARMGSQLNRSAFGRDKSD